MGKGIGLAVALVMTLTAKAADMVSYSRQQLFPGFDGKTCKVQPSVATDGKGTVLLTWQNLLLAGSDVFYGESMAKSGDGGRTFSPGIAQPVLESTWEGGIRTAYYGSAFYSKRHSRWFGLGNAQLYANDKMPMLKGDGRSPAAYPLFLTVDPGKGTFTSRRPIGLPFAYDRMIVFGPVTELENGELLVAFYGCPLPNKGKHHCVVTRCRLTDDNLEILEVGDFIGDDGYPRGICEPSVAHLGGRYYITLRTDTQGLWARSEDGLHYSTPQPWRWDDGALLENYNTQQHWMAPEEGLYLAYTRKGAHNDHVFRHRAPLFMAKFDPVRECLVRSTEVILVPERGARLGNFNTIDVSPTESWLVTAEWMQDWDGRSETCVKYGSDNALWLARVDFRIDCPGPSMKGGASRGTKGALCLTFDDRNFAGWRRELPRFRRYGAHATFFVNGAIDEAAVETMKALKSEGHSLGFHGLTHSRATDLLATLGEDGYLRAEVLPQVDAARAAGLDVVNWAYPMSRRSGRTDAVLGRYFKRLRTGCLFRKAIVEDPMDGHDEVFVPAKDASSRKVLFGTAIPSAHPTWLEDVAGALRRAAERNEILVLYAHDIRNDGGRDPHDISGEQLESILSAAGELGLPVIGFDELDDAGTCPRRMWHD